MAKQIPERSQLAPETTWQITDLYPTDEAWQAARKDFLALLERIPPEVLDEFRKPKTARREAHLKEGGIA